MVVKEDLQRDVSAYRTRRKARVLAFQALYEIDIRPCNPDTVLESDIFGKRFKRGVISYARKLVEGVLCKKGDVDSLISVCAPSWPIEQISLVDRNILRLAIFELMGDDVPQKVVINEAVELGKIFGADNTTKFVNGVLGSLTELEAVTLLESMDRR